MDFSAIGKTPDRNSTDITGSNDDAKTYCPQVVRADNASTRYVSSAIDSYQDVFLDTAKIGADEGLHVRKNRTDSCGSEWIRPFWWKEIEFLERNKKAIFLIIIWGIINSALAYGSNYTGTGIGNYANHYVGCRDSMDDVLRMCDYTENCIEKRVYRCAARCETFNVYENNKFHGMGIDDDRVALVGNNDNGYHNLSWFCAAAQQSGFSSWFRGGCFRIVDRRDDLEYLEASNKNGIASVGYVAKPGQKLQTYRVEGVENSYLCTDLSIWGYVFNAISTSVSHIITKDPMYFYIWTNLIAFFSVIFYGGTHSVVWITQSLPRLLSLITYTYFVYKNFKRNTMEYGIKKKLYITIFIVFLYGALNYNTIFYSIDYISLTQHKFDRNYYLLWSVIGFFAIFIVYRELLGRYQESTIVKYLISSLTTVFIMILLPIVLGLSFRIHHWELGLYALCFASRYTYFFDWALFGLGNGLFIEGLGRWGLAPTAF